MLTLGVDTSESLGGVALYEPGRLAECRMMSTPLSHAECLFPLIDSILETHSIEKTAIDRVSVNRGPGSFTGLRIGLAAMKGFCQSLGIPLVGVDGTEVYRQLAADEQRVCVVIASRRDVYYARWFSGDRPKGDTEVIREAELVARLHRETRPLCLVGSGATRLEKTTLPWPNIHIAPDASNEPSPLAVAQRGESEHVADQLYSVEPLYVEPLLIGGKAT